MWLCNKNNLDFVKSWINSYTIFLQGQFDTHLLWYCKYFLRTGLFLHSDSMLLSFCLKSLFLYIMLIYFYILCTLEKFFPCKKFLFFATFKHFIFLLKMFEMYIQGDIWPLKPGSGARNFEIRKNGSPIVKYNCSKASHNLFNNEIINKGLRKLSGQ